MTCPFCGAAKIEYDNHTGFECGSWVGGSNVEQSPPCRELCQLREKKAEGLTWEDFIPGKVIDCKGIFGSGRITDSSTWGGSVYLTVISRSGAVGSYHDTIDAAKAHAEELHQQAWRELRARWDFKGGGE